MSDADLDRVMLFGKEHNLAVMSDPMVLFNEATGDLSIQDGAVVMALVNLKRDGALKIATGLLQFVRACDDRTRTRYRGMPEGRSATKERAGGRPLRP